MQAILLILRPLLAGIGGVLLKMLISALSGPVVERLILSALDLLIVKYEKRAAATEDPMDDATVHRVRELYNQWVASLAK